MGQFLRRLAFLFNRSRRDEELKRDLEFHREMAAREGSGVRLGNPLVIREESREAWGWMWLDRFGADLRYAVRMLRRSPALGLAAILCLGLGTGATTAIFSVVNAVLLRPLQYAHSGRLTRVFTDFPKEVSSTSPFGFRHFWLSPPEYFDLKRDAQSWDAFEGWANNPANLAGASEPIRTTVSFVTGGMLNMLGVPPLMGRLLNAEDDRPNATQHAVLSYDLWQSAFAGDPNILERDIRLNGRSCTVIGVMPKSFTFPPGEANPSQLWSALRLDPANTNRGSHFVSVLARLRPGVPLRQAQAEMQRYETEQARIHPQSFHPFSPDQHPIVLAGFQDDIVQPVRPAMLVLMGAVAFVLLITCVNVANLLLARSEARRREIAVRAAIGAGAGRLLSQFVAEGLVLSLAGSMLGLGLAFETLKLLTKTGAGTLPRAEEIGMDWRVLLFSAGMAILTGLVFGLAPILHIRLSGLHDSLKSAGGRNTSSVASNRFRSILVGSELALALVLLIGSGLMVKAFWKLQDVNAGIKPDHLLTMQISLPRATYTTEAQANNFWSSLLARVRALPGVESAAISSGLPPMRPVNANTTPLEGVDPGLAGPPPTDPSMGAAAPTIDYWNVVDPGYFHTVGARLVAGRLLSSSDGTGAPPVIVINEAMARAFWPGKNPIGRRAKIDFAPGATVWHTIVGVVGDIKNAGLDRSTGTELYIPYQQQSTVAATNNFTSAAALIVHTSVDPASLAGAARSQVHSLDATVPVSEVKTMEEVMSQAVSRPRFVTLAMTMFSTLALVLAALGIYGVISYTVTQRTSEIGIRMALGARTGDIVRMVSWSGLQTAVAGTAAGTLGAIALTRFLSGLLFGVSSLDVATFAAMAGVLGTVTLLGCYIPARRASRIHPTIALRNE